MINENEVLEYFKMCLNDDDEEMYDDDYKNSKTCLISSERLVDKYITLPCGHKFNYIPIFNEVYNQKCIVNHKEISRVPHRCIKCPYCRNICNGILPYRENIISDKIEGVNWPLKYAIKNEVCSYVFMSGKKKGIKCNNSCVDKYCSKHETIGLKMEEKNKIINLSQKERCNHKIKTKTGTRMCKKYAKEKGYCGIHLKLYNNID